MNIVDRPGQDEMHVLASSSDTNGVLFRFEYIAKSVTAPPANHVHGDQEERVEVVAETLSCRVHEDEFLWGAGESLTFTPGVPHAVWNADPNRSRVIGEFGPALDTQEAMLPESTPGSQEASRDPVSVQGG